MNVIKRENSLQQRVALWIVVVGIGTIAIFSALFWSSGIPLYNLAKKPSLYYAGFRVIQNLSGFFINFLLILIGYVITKSNKTNFRFVIQQWLVVFSVGLVVFLVFLFGFQKMKLHNLFDVLFPLIRNVYPLLTGAFLGQLSLPFLKTLLKTYDSKKIFHAMLLIGTIPTIFNKNIFGLGSGDTALFSLYLFILGSLFALSKRKLINKPWLWLILCLAMSVILNLLMPYITYGWRISLGNAGRFTQNGSAFILLASIYLFGGLKKMFNKLDIDLFGKKEIQHVTLFILGVLMVSAPSMTKLINEVNIRFPFDIVKQKLVVTLLEAMILAFLLFIVETVLKAIFDKLDIGVKYQGKNILQAIEIASQDVKQFLHSRNFLMLAVFYVLSFLSMLLMNDAVVVDQNTQLRMNIFTYTFFTRQQMIWLNVLVLLGLFAILRLIFAGRYWLPFMITSLFVVIWAVASKVKLILRQEPVLPADMAEVKNIGSLLKMIDIKLVILGVFLIAAFIGFAIYMEVKHSGKKLHWGKSIFYAVFSLVCLSGSFFANSANTPPKLFLDLFYDNRFFINQTNGARINGPLIQFINNIDVDVMEEPTGYSRTKMMNIYHKYSGIEKSINNSRKNKVADQTVIMALSESFSDPKRVPGLEINKDPIPYIRSLKKQTTSGLMISSGYGGGTANMEYMALTGFGLANFSRTLATPYTQLVDYMKETPSIAKNFNNSVAVHPYQGVYYNRPNVYDKFGFDKFAYQGSKTPIHDQHKLDNSNYLSDQTAYENVVSQIKQQKGGQLINLVTMQNHLPYNPGTYKDRGFRATGQTAANESDRTEIQEYMTGLSYTDSATKSFIKELDRVQKPITLVFYGDHLPGIYTGVSQLKFGLQMHETDYFIYSNKFARDHGYGMKKMDSNVTKITNPTDFYALAMEQNDSKVDPYSAFLTTKMRELPSFGSGIFDKKYDFVNSQGQAVPEKDLTRKQKNIVKDYRLIQYDMTAGKQYLAKTNFFNK